MFNGQRLYAASACASEGKRSTATMLRGPGLQEKTAFRRKAGREGAEESKPTVAGSSPQPGKVQAVGRVLDPQQRPLHQ